MNHVGILVLACFMSGLSIGGFIVMALNRNYRTSATFVWALFCALSGLGYGVVLWASYLIPLALRR